MKLLTMKSISIALAVAGVVCGATASVQAQSMTDYQAQPPFISGLVPPNVLIIMDNSGSMTNRACEVTNCGILPSGAASNNTSYVYDTKYSGLFNPLTCYLYDATDERFEPSTTKTSIGAACGSTQWDGNFLNWALTRRFDAVKKAMVGGDCHYPADPTRARDADGACKPYGTPSMVTVKGQSKFAGSGDGHETTPHIPFTGSGTESSYVGRIPSTVTRGGLSVDPTELFIHIRGGSAGMQGMFCLDDDNGAPGNTNGNCGDGDSYNESMFRLAVAQNYPAEGVIHKVGPKARFGLALFNQSNSDDGLRVLVGTGMRQSIDWGGSQVETFNTNTAAVVDAVEEAYPSTYTPLGESLYEATRYFAQINSSFYPSQYVYPIAYAGGNSNGKSFGVSGVGSFGNNEIKAISGTEVCPAGYITDACGRDPYLFGSNFTPPWATTSQIVACCKTFVLIFTDGEPTEDLDVPSGIKNAAASISGTPCTGGSTTIHTANGVCNTNSATPPATLLTEHKTDYGINGSHYLNDVAYWAHTTDIRQATIPGISEAGHDIPGVQSITTYTFYAFGTINGRELLMHTAQQGGFDDSDNNKIPNLQVEWDKVNNYDGTSGSTVAGCNADCIPDTYFESSNIEDLEERLLATLVSILKKSASGSSVSVLASSVTGDGALYQAYFYTGAIGSGGDDVKWLGFTEGLFIDRYGNLREDTVQDGRLVLSEDLIITTRYDDDSLSPTYGKVLVNKFVDANGDGVADSTTPTVGNQELRDIKSIWEAGKKLALTPSASRNIVTWVDLNNDKVVDANEQMAFSTANAATLSPYLRASATGVNTANNIINFIRGDAIAGMRYRTMDVQNGVTSVQAVWKYGDPIHSPPTLVGIPQANFHLAYGDATYLNFYRTYRNRRQVIYVGANDGMLHAFNGGYYHSGDDPSTTTKVENGWFTKNPTDNTTGSDLGTELFAYVPYELLPQLQFLTEAQYSHVYYVDLKPKVYDVRIFTPDADHPDGWGTILVGGFRLGGSCGQCQTGGGAPPLTVNIGGTNQTFYSAFFVLDITNPEVTPKLLMSFSDPGLGLTTSAPALARVSPSSDATTDATNAKWYLLFGSGPNGYNVDFAVGNQTAKLYAIDLKTGVGVNNSSVTSMAIGTWKSFMADLTSIDRNLDYRVDSAYVGRTIHDGTLPWRGKMYRLSMKGCVSAPCSPNTWGIANGSGRTATEVLDTFLDSGSVVQEMGPTMTAPALTVDDAGESWLFFGTGRYFSPADKVDTQQQYIFGVKDSVANGLCTESSVANCHDDNLVDVSSAVLCITCATGGSNQVSGVSGATDFDSMIHLVQSKRGWFAKLKTVGERSIVAPTFAGGAIFFPTFTPTLDLCASSGISRLYALYYKTGTASKDPILGTSTDAAGNTTANGSLTIGSGLASSVVVQIIATPEGCMTCGGGSNNAMLYIHTDSGATQQQKAKLPEKMWSRYLTWLHQRD